MPVAPVSVPQSDGALLQRKSNCACGGGCPSCAEETPRGTIQTKLQVSTPGDHYEQQADRVAEQIVSMAAPAIQNEVRHDQARPLVQRLSRVADNPATANAIQLGEESGQPLAASTREFMEPRFGADFSHVRLHTDQSANEKASLLNARAFTSGHDIWLGKKETESDRSLIAHELTHVIQQTSPSVTVTRSTGPVITSIPTPVLARSVDQWLAGSVNLGQFTYTQLLGELDDLHQYLQRQTSSSADTVRVEQGLALLRAEVGRREAAAGPRRPTQRGRRGRAAPSSAEPLPARYPRILTELTSVAYADPAEMRAEYDLIMQWLARQDISANERRILVAERNNLAPQLRTDREQVVTERHAARVRSALTPGDQNAAGALQSLARIIQSIAGEPGNSGIFYIYHQGERIAISDEQARGLRANLTSELRRAANKIDSTATYYWDRYHSQRAINRDSPIIAGISGWLADVEDPGNELASRYFWIRERVRAMQEHLAAGRLIEAAGIVGSVEHVSEEIRSLSRAFYEGHIHGAEIAVHRLEITRDVSFAIAASIAAVVAAPVVAGAVGVGGLGLTGVSAGVATTVGTGVVVGSGVAVARGGSAAGGTALAGGSLSEVGAALRSEAARGFHEGFMAGAGGGFARVLGPALGVGTTLSGQALRRVAAEMIVNGTAAMADVLLQGGTIGQAVDAGARAASLSVPGALLGGSHNPAVRYLVAPLTSGATAYAGAIGSGATREQAMLAAATAVATNLSISASSHSSAADQALVARGQSIGTSVRSTAASATRRVASVTAAVMIGTADALPPVHSGFGGTSVVLDSQAIPTRGSRVGASPPSETTLPTAVSSDTAPSSPASVRPSEAPLESAVPQGVESPVVSPPTVPPSVETPNPVRARPVRGATAEGVGDEFRYGDQPEPSAPSVERGGRAARRGQAPDATASPRRPDRPTRASPVEEPARRSTSSEIADELAETSGGTSRGGTSSDPDVLNLPNPHAAEEVAAGSSGSQFSSREVWEAPPHAAPAPPLEAPAARRLAWLQERLQLHVEQAIERYRIEGLTLAQEARIRETPGLARANRGSRIDQFAKDSIAQDPELAALITAPDFISEPDILDSVLPQWFDMTTTRQWLEHTQKYGPRYGAGVRLPTD